MSMYIIYSVYKDRIISYSSHEVGLFEKPLFISTIVARIATQYVHDFFMEHWRPSSIKCRVNEPLASLEDKTSFTLTFSHSIEHVNMPMALFLVWSVQLYQLSLRWTIMMFHKHKEHGVLCWFCGHWSHHHRFIIQVMSQCPKPMWLM